MSSQKLGTGTLYVMNADGTQREVGKLLSVETTEISPIGKLTERGSITVTTSLDLFIPADTPEGIYERNCGPFGPLDPPTHDGCVPSPRTGWIIENFSSRNGHDQVHEACGIRWDVNDVLRFLNNFCRWYKREDGKWCLMFTGARSRGKGNKAWYGSFWCKGKSVRAHKFFAVAILGLRPRPNREDELDHHCFNTRCVSCVVVKTHAENQKRIRRRKDYEQQ